MEFMDDMDVRLINHMGSDQLIIAAAKVSTAGESSLEELKHETRTGLIRYLLTNRHGTPFEHAAMTFFVKAPIFVFREFHRHRIGFSYNEESARYKQLNPHFYVPSVERPGMMQVPGGKPGQYQYVDATSVQADMIRADLKRVYTIAYTTYEGLLRDGVAKEVARMCLPVAIYSSMYVTCNPRSLMAFLSLRTKREPWWIESEEHLGFWYHRTEGTAQFPSKPQYEINVVADQMEEIFRQLFPHTWLAYNQHGRVAP